MPRPNVLTLAALAAALAVTPFAAANAQGPGVAPNIAVPSPSPVPAPVPSPGGSFFGSWQVSQDLYGPYRMTFTLGQFGGGSYSIRGGGLYCDGGLDWYQSGNSAVVSLRYSYCGNNVGWTGDSMTCRANDGYPGNWQFQGRPDAIAVPQQGIAVPVPSQSANQLRCTYQPAVRGYQPISILADRLSY